MDYIELLNKYYPGITASIIGDPTIYGNINWIVGGPISEEDFAALDLSEAKLIRKEQVNSVRDVKKDQGVWYMNHLFDSDQTARENVNGMVNALVVGASLPPDFSWRDAHNQNVSMTSQQLITMGVLLTQYISNVYKRSWELKSEIEILGTTMDVQGYNIDIGWPLNTLDGTGPTT